jgi:hypothetical protein
MQDPPKPRPAVAVAAVLMVLGLRLAWFASHSDIGWEQLRHDWTTMLADFAGLNLPVWDDWPSEDQARFWLREVEQLEVGEPSASHLAGAAWVLDTPQRGFIRNHFRVRESLNEIPDLPLGARIGIDYDAVDLALQSYEAACHERCFQLIDHAARIDAASVDRWRTRALLVLPPDPLEPWFKPRHADWQSILVECAERDPENALYDYLAALCDWKSSADYRVEDQGYLLEVHDKETFERGRRRFAAGLAKPSLNFGTTGDDDLLGFLESSSLSRVDRLTAAESRTMVTRCTSLLAGLLRWQEIQQSDQQQNGDLTSAAVTLRQTLHLARQVSTTGNPPGLMFQSVFMQRWSLANLRSISAADPKVIGPAEAAEIDRDLDGVRRTFNFLNEADRATKSRDRHQPASRSTITASVAFIAQPIAAILLFLGLAFAIASTLCTRWCPARAEEPVRLGLASQLVAWTSGFGLSYVVFGMCPAKLISDDIQSGVLCGFEIAALAVPLLVTLRILRRNFRVGYGQLLALSASVALPVVALLMWPSAASLVIAVVARLPLLATLTLLIVGTGATGLVIKADRAFLRRSDIDGGHKRLLFLMIAVLSVAATFCGTLIGRLMELTVESKICIPPRVWMEARPWGLTADQLQSGMELQRHPWLWSLLQWHAYSGFYVMVAFMWLILMAWCSVRKYQEMRRNRGAISKTTRSVQLQRLATLSERTFVVAGLVALLVYLGAEPAAIEIQETRHQMRLTQRHEQSTVCRELEKEAVARNKN